MHPTAMRNCRHFFECYGGYLPRPGRLVEVGSQDVNGSLRELCPADMEYVGVDFAAGKGVDLVLSDPYKLPFENETVDAVLCSSVLEHSQMFWVTFLEMLRILKPSGLIYILVPSNGDVHRYPVDCWRFYPDSGQALVAWAKRNGMNPALLESYTSLQVDHQWNDYVSVFVKDEAAAGLYPRRILQTKTDYMNGWIRGGRGFLNAAAKPEDRLRLEAIVKAYMGLIKPS